MLGRFVCTEKIASGPVPAERDSVRFVAAEHGEQVAIAPKQTWPRPA